MHLSLDMHNSRWEICLLIGDMALFFGAIPLLLLWQYNVSSWSQIPFGWDTALLLLLGIYLVVIYVSDLYDKYKDYRTLENISRLIFAAWVGMLLGVMVISYASRFLSRNFVEWHAVLFCVLLVAWRTTFSALALPQRLKRRVLIIGAGDAGQQILELIQARSGNGLEAVGFIDDDPAKNGRMIHGVPVLGTCQELAELIRDRKVDIVVLAIIREKSPQLIKTLGYLAFNHCHLLDMPRLYEQLARKIPLDYITDSWLYLHGIYQSKLYYRHVKRLMDLSLGAVGLVLCAPLFPVIAAAIKLNSQGPVFFRQQRLGQAGKPFTIIKFRTMTEAETDEKPRWACPDDPRITRVGWYLRKWRLDEVPQLINVLKGDMSLIGPRAEWDVFALKSQEEEVQYRPGRRAGDPPGFMVPTGQVERVPYYSFRSVVKPGITGWAQVMFPMAGSSFEDLKEKLAYDLYYIKNLGILLDLAILLRTIRIVLIGRGK